MERTDAQRNKIVTPPYESDIVAAIKSCGGTCITPIIRSILSPRFAGLKTSHVLYRMKKMEAQGIVKRIRRKKWCIDWELV